MTKTDEKAADRVMTRAVAKTTALIRAGHDRADYVPVLEAAIVAAAVLMEPGK